MNREAATKWVIALRSGRYKQGTEALNSNGKLCCLGVACEAAREDGVPVERNDGVDVTRYDGEADALPASVRGWLGVDNPNPRLNGTEAIDRNDELGETFETIAQAIEWDASLT